MNATVAGNTKPRNRGGAPGTRRLVELGVGRVRGALVDPAMVSGGCGHDGLLSSGVIARHRGTARRPVREWAGPGRAPSGPRGPTSGRSRTTSGQPGSPTRRSSSRPRSAARRPSAVSSRSSPCRAGRSTCGGRACPRRSAEVLDPPVGPGIGSIMPSRSRRSAARHVGGVAAEVGGHLRHGTWLLQEQQRAGLERRQREALGDAGGSRRRAVDRAEQPQGQRPGLEGQLGRTGVRHRMNLSD